jgi:hypothetical protein
MNYIIKNTQGDIVGWGYCGPNNFNAGAPAGLEWVDAPYIPPAPRQTQLTKLQAMERFTDAELAAIYTAAKASVAVEVWLEKFKAATEIDLTNASFIAGVDGLEGSGLIAAGRAAEILA